VITAYIWVACFLFLSCVQKLGGLMGPLLWFCVHGVLLGYALDATLEGTWLYFCFKYYKSET
jgi:hypothetical protein